MRLLAPLLLMASCASPESIIATNPTTDPPSPPTGSAGPPLIDLQAPENTEVATFALG